VRTGSTLHDEDGQPLSLPAGWTDVVPADPFVVIAAGRSAFTTDDLLALADLVDRLRAHADAGLRKVCVPRIPSTAPTSRFARQTFGPVMIIDHVPAVRVPPDHAASNVAAAIPA
jgi:Family of unknown function (DUF5372)